MPSLLPEGIPVPNDGVLPQQAALAADKTSFSAYVHVPYCRVRCGYCDFNTYTAKELGGAKQTDYWRQVVGEIEFAAAALEKSAVKTPPLATVFFGGGTPTLLPAADLTQILNALKQRFGILPGAEITVEANPDSVDIAYLEKLKTAGFTRVSIGMQSAVPETLKVLDRTHNPERVGQVVSWAKQVDLQVSVDLIYGAPGETLADWQKSVTTALSYDPDHISAYALIVETGTKLAAQIRRGVYALPDDDLQAEMYEFADASFSAAGYSWYEISNWAKSVETRSRHNLAYWQGGNWWGFGPGAHSHVGGVRWWNVKHPSAYADRVRQAISPGYAREILDSETRRTERVLLETRIAAGLDISILKPSERKTVPELIAAGLIDGHSAIKQGRIVPTLRGRLLADTVIAKLLQ